MKILIADSGSTKTDWCVAENGCILRRIQAEGINPVYLTDEELCGAARSVARQLDGLRPEAIRFYGAGCIPTQTERVRHALRQAFAETDDVEVSWGRAATRATTMAQRLWRTYLPWASSWAMRGAARCSASSWWAAC